jgi:hypothetical protein
MGRSMAQHIAHQPGPVRVDGNVSRWLAGVGGGFGGGAAPAPPLATRGWGCFFFFNSSGWLRKTRGVPWPLGAAPEGLGGMAEL